MANSHTEILIVAQAPAVAMQLKAVLAELGYAVGAVASCGRDAVGIASDARPDLALVDLGLQGNLNGPEVGDQLCGGPDVPVVYLTDVAEGDLFDRAQATNPYGYVLKPFDARQLDLNVRAALCLHERVSRHRETRARLEQSIEESKCHAELMETVFNSMGEGVVAVGEDGTILFHNSSGPRIGGSHPLVKDIARWPEEYGVFQPDGETVLSKDLNPLMLALRGQSTEETEFLIRNHQKPEGVQVSVNARPLRDRAGSPMGGVAVIRDVTKLKQAEAELERTVAKLQEQASLMETIFNSISDGIIVADTAGKFLYANPGARQIVGMDTLDGFPENCADKLGLYLPDRETRANTEDLPLMRAIRFGESTDEEDVFLRNEKKPDGVYIRMSGRPLLDKSGRITGGVRDFSRRNRACACGGGTGAGIRPGTVGDGRYHPSQYRQCDEQCHYGN